MSSIRDHEQFGAREELVERPGDTAVQGRIVVAEEDPARAAELFELGDHLCARLRGAAARGVGSCSYLRPSRAGRRTSAPYPLALLRWHYERLGGRLRSRARLRILVV